MMRNLSGLLAVLATFALVTTSFAAVRGVAPGSSEQFPKHHAFDTAALGNPTVSVADAGRYIATHSVSWVIGGKKGWYYAPLRCQMLLNGRWISGDLVDWDGQWNAYAWYGVRSGNWYKQAAQFRVGSVYRWYYSWVYVGYPDDWGWYETDDWVVKL